MSTTSLSVFNAKQVIKNVFFNHGTSTVLFSPVPVTKL